MKAMVDMGFLRQERRRALVALRSARRRYRTAERKLWEAKRAMRGIDKATARIHAAAKRLEAREDEFRGIERALRSQRIYSVPRDRLDEVVLRRVSK